LALVEGSTLRVKRVSNAPKGSYPVDGDFQTGTPFGTVLYVAEEPKALKVGESEGRLGLALREGNENAVVELSKPLLGAVGPQGMIRPYAIAGRGTEQGLRIAVALARTAGSLGGAGLAVVEKAAALTAQAFLQGDLAKESALIPLKDSRDVAITRDGKGALVAAGTEGVLSVDLEKKAPVARMSLGSEEWLADRILLGNRGDMVIAFFLKPSSRQVLLKIFGLTPNLQMQEYGAITGIPAVETAQGYRAPGSALTEDDLYLFLPQGRVLSVFNLSDAGNPVKIVESDTPGTIRQVTIANRFKDIFAALGAAGLARLEFGF
jgi:hypothetical protein